MNKLKKLMKKVDEEGKVKSYNRVIEDSRKYIKKVLKKRGIK